MPSFHMEVYGCQMNVRDSQHLEGILLASGHERAKSPENADVIIVVTCAVRERAEVRALGRATQLAGGSRGRKPLLVICGCVAQEHGGSLLKRFPQIDLVVGPDAYHRLPELISSGSRAALVEQGTDDYEALPSVRNTFPRAFVTITRGCDNFCSYCIVPFVRGRERSRTPEAILAEVRGLVGAGYREITLLGQNVNSYRSGQVSFPGLLDEVARAAAPAWVRFVTSHPRDLGEDLADVMADHSNICRAIHLPAQSGSDAVLKGMNRAYTRSGYLDKIGMLRSRMPGIVLSTDMIAGFPGESEADFQDSLSLLAEVRFDYGFLFRYSERKGTRAAEMPGAVPVPERLARLHRLQELQNAVTREKSSLLVGRCLPVLVTGPGTREGQLVGRTPGNRVVVVPEGGACAGSFMDVRITRADGWTHYGEKA
ncbi:MAG: tRNA (N6-isopentenyl adenosine(37)-C2)-methylthiotransferase MiaB [Candidatus Fermentibacteraceae bacterium]